MPSLSITGTKHLCTLLKNPHFLHVTPGASVRCSALRRCSKRALTRALLVLSQFQRPSPAVHCLSPICALPWCGGPRGAFIALTEGKPIGCSRSDTHRLQ